MNGHSAEARAITPPPHDPPWSMELPVFRRGYSCLEKSGKISVRNKKSCVLVKGKEKEERPSSNEQYGHIS